MERVLIIGSSGLLGLKTYKLFSKYYKTIGADLKPIKNIDKSNFYQINITDKSYVLKSIKKISPNIVILTAALTAVDYCEDHHEEAWNINVEGPRNVAMACQETKSNLIYISTDFVFDGKKGNYSESDRPNPISYYGITKLEGEKAINESQIKYAIARTSVIFGWNTKEQKTNYVTWIINKLQNIEPIKIVTSQVNTPTLADNLAEALLMIVKKNQYDLFHICGKECLTRYQFALKIAEVFNLKKELITPIEYFEQLAKRPKLSCLDTTKASTILKIKLLTISEALSLMKEKKKNS
ncbi:MAG: dTDP-4-dehydrorhamnose reductase [Candidatus Helarchaeota archaeon]|nr:dTDP-4-dehydrorhamnose reductase [Candidatus Helarchaeota archaeon]